MKKASEALDNIQKKMPFRRQQLESGKTRLTRVSPKPPAKQKDEAADTQKQDSK